MSITPQIDRPIDIALFGATGFTGSLIVAYLAYNYPSLRITLVGRDKIRLNYLADRHHNADFDVYSVPDMADESALRDVIARTKVVISAAGPFMKIGTPLVRVCISCHTHYCDITGETPWVARNLLPLHAAAQANKTYIVNFCGFDSQPADLLVAEAQRILQEPLDRANALVAMRGSMSGGTLRSGIEMEALPEMSDPYCLGGSPGKESENDAHPIERSDRLGCWLAPFGMAMINTRVVRRSASLKGRQFPYGEAMCVSDEKTAKRLASVPSAEVRKKLVERGKLPRPGQGPDPLTRTRSWFKYVVSATGKSGKEIWLQLSGGDAGYDETALMVSEAAVALLNGEAISGRWGVVTPGYAFDSQKMINRLVNAGLEFQRLPGAPSVGTILERPSRNAVQGKWREAVADMSAIMSRL